MEFSPEKAVLRRHEIGGAAAAGVDAGGPLADLGEQCPHWNAARQSPPVTAIGRNDPVPRSHRSQGTDRNRLLSGAQVDRAGNHVLSTELSTCLLELPNGRHGTKRDQQPRRGLTLRRHSLTSPLLLFDRRSVVLAHSTVKWRIRVQIVDSRIAAPARATRASGALNTPRSADREHERWSFVTAFRWC